MNRPDALKLLKGIAMVGIYGGLLMPAMFLPVVIFPFVFSKLIYFQVLIALTFPAYVALAWAEPKYRPRWTSLAIAIGAYFVAIGLSVAFAADPARAWWGNQERMNGLFTVLHFFLWFLMASSLLTTWAQWRRLLAFEIAVSAFMASVALLQKPFPRLLRFEAQGRVGGLLDNPIYMAGYQIFNFFFIALLWLKGVSKKAKFWLFAALALDIGAFLVAQSRGALLGLAVGVVVFGLTYAILGASRKARFGAVGLILAFFGGYGLIYANRAELAARGSVLARLANLQATTETRFIAWKIAWEGFLERPLTGWGYDNYHVLFNAKYNPQSLRFGYYETWFDRAHNTVMDVLSMTGLIGFLTYVGMWVALFHSVYRAYRRKWIDLPFASVLVALPCAYFVQNLFVFDQPAGFMMSFLMYAFVNRATQGEFVGQKDDSVVAGPAGDRSPWVVFAVVGAFGLLVAWRFSVLPFRASMRTIQANMYFAAGYYAPAFALAKQAAEIPTPYLDEQTFLQARNVMDLLGRQDLDKVFPQWKEWHALIKQQSEAHLATHGASTHPNFIYARYLQEAARRLPEEVPLADEYYRKAIETSPKRQQLYFTYARFLLEQGKKQEAYDLFRKAAEFDPEVGEAWWYAGVTHMFDLGDHAEAPKEIVRSQKASSPYQPRSYQEIAPLAVAYQDLQDPEGFKALMDMAERIGGGTGIFYLDIARVAETLGLPEERDRALAWMVKADPTAAPRVVPLQEGKAKTILESFQMTEPVSAPAPAPTPVPVPSASGSGPRR